MRSLTRVIRVPEVFTVLLRPSTSLFSHTLTGRILGTVTDRTGAAVSGATVTIVDVQRGRPEPERPMMWCSNVAPSLSPSSYKVRVEAKGFKTVERVDIPGGSRTGCAD